MNRKDTLHLIYERARTLAGKKEAGNDSELTLDQALEIIKIEQIGKIASICFLTHETLEKIRISLNDDISYSVSIIGSRLNEVAKTLFDTLGSSKTDDALDALINLSNEMTDRGDV